MDILYLLIPLSAVLVLLILGLFGWALHRGQFDDVEREGARFIDADVPAGTADAASFDPGQRPAMAGPEQSRRPSV